MAQDHLQLHGQPLDNGKKTSRKSGGTSSSSRGGESRLELKQVIAQENGQGKDLCSQLIQHPKLHAKIMPSLCRVSDEYFQQRHDISLAFKSCNFKGGVVLAIPVIPFLVLDIPKICHLQ